METKEITLRIRENKGVRADNIPQGYCLVVYNFDTEGRSINDSDVEPSPDGPYAIVQRFESDVTGPERHSATGRQLLIDAIVEATHWRNTWSREARGRSKGETFADSLEIVLDNTHVILTDGERNSVVNRTGECLA